MKIGLCFDLRCDDTEPANTARRYGATLELCEEADRLGCDSLWFSEHHGFEDGYLPQPLTMAAAVAARTRQTRIGTAISIAPLHHPADLAEQATVVDLLSEGRFDLGLGAGYRAAEFELFGADLERRYQATDECVRNVRELWASTRISPKPLQSPLPIWLGYLGPRGARRAGRLGTGLLSADPSLWSHYREGLVDAGHPSSAGRMAGGIQGWVSDDPEREWSSVARHLAQQVGSYRTDDAGQIAKPRPVDTDRMRATRPFEHHSLSYFSFGTAEEVARQIRASVFGAPVETVFLWASIGAMPIDVVAGHVQRVCSQLAPLLAEFDAGQSEAP